MGGGGEKENIRANDITMSTTITIITMINDNDNDDDNDTVPTTATTMITIITTKASTMNGIDSSKPKRR